jgi:hypothetical protein
MFAHVCHMVYADIVLRVVCIQKARFSSYYIYYTITVANMYFAYLTTCLLHTLWCMHMCDIQVVV